MLHRQSYTTVLQVTASPARVYSAITQHIDQWWTQLANEATHVGDILEVRFEEATAWRMRVEEAAPNQVVVWYVIDASHKLQNLATYDEWKGTTIRWKIANVDAGSAITFAHEGLVPALECYDICQRGWDYFLGSLKRFLETGTGSPYTP